MSELNAMSLAADAFEAWHAGAPKDQLAAKMLDAAVCLAVEEIGVVKVMDGLLAVIACLRDECPREWEMIRFMHADPADWQRSPNS